MVSFDPKVQNNLFKVGAVNLYTPAATSFKGGEVNETFCNCGVGRRKN